MPRPRAYDEEAAVEAAKDVFWDRGYLATTITDLEHGTGLSRSSLYVAFGTKRNLFFAALEAYMTTFIQPMLGPVERQGASPRDAAAFFRRLAVLFRQPASDRGCLMINSMVELGGYDKDVTRRGADFANRYRSAFTNALQNGSGQTPAGRRQIKERSELLATATMGVWVAVRIDHAAAAVSCRSLASQLDTWR